MGGLTDWLKSKVVDSYYEFINGIVSAIISSFSKLGITISTLSAKLLLFIISLIVIAIALYFIKHIIKFLIVILTILFIISLFLV